MNQEIHVNNRIRFTSELEYNHDQQTHTVQLSNQKKIIIQNLMNSSPFSVSAAEVSIYRILC
jgi:hypothetical protein